MANSYVPVQMDIGSSRIILVNIRSDVAEYFGMPTVEDTGDAVITRRRKAHTRSRFDGLSDNSATSSNVSAAEWKTVQKVAKLGSGKKVRIPTKLTSGDKKNIRYTSIRVPGNATVGATPQVFIR